MLKIKEVNHRRANSPHSLCYLRERGTGHMSQIEKELLSLYIFYLGQRTCPFVPLLKMDIWLLLRKI